MEEFSTYLIRNMLTNCSIHLTTLILEKNHISIKSIKLGEITIKNSENLVTSTILNKILNPYGLEVIKSREEQTVEKIKRTIVELIHESNNANSIIRKSDYLVEKMGMSYQHISKLFSKYEDITLERFSILVKIEKIKEMILQDEYSLSEIAYLMDYSSVQYLSNQFKKETGINVSDFKKVGDSERRGLDKLY